MQPCSHRLARMPSSLLALGLLVGCGPSEPVEMTVEVTGNDQMKFSVERIEVDAPAKVTIAFRNVGKMPKVAMGHNFVLLKQGVNALEFASECVSGGAVAENEFLPESLRDRALGWTKVLGPGEEDSFVAELLEPGSYPFVCTFPGHFAQMKGVLVAR
ncbi:MAG: plastocyanin/azurin family copper-binding protein [Planctomycetota bacterium]|nr:plastocyanin/azurin family copper-binding protein [Planctomycetota bacterium]